MSVDSNKVYYAYTEHVNAYKLGYYGVTVETARATIAMKIKGNIVTYGVSVCSGGDNFNKEVGRKIAEERLNAGYGTFTINDKLYHKFKDSHEMSLYFLNNITNATELNLRKVQQKIGIWNKEKRKDTGQRLLGHEA